MNTIVKMILPVAVFALASAGAVSTQPAKGEASKALITGYIQFNNNPQDCRPVQVDCTTFNTGQLCMDPSDTNQVYQKDEGLLECTVPLYKIN
jgi:hypothetical protein